MRVFSILGASVYPGVVPIFKQDLASWSVCSVTFAIAFTYGY